MNLTVIFDEHEQENLATIEPIKTTTTTTTTMASSSSIQRHQQDEKSGNKQVISKSSSSEQSNILRPSKELSNVDTKRSSGNDTGKTAQSNGKRDSI